MEGIQVPAQAPEWVQGLTWVIISALLALAVVGPKIFGPIIERFRATLPQSKSAGIDTTQMAVIGSALADKDAVNRLAESIERLSDLIEDRIQRENAVAEEERTRSMIKRLMKELEDRDPPHRD